MANRPASAKGGKAKQMTLATPRIVVLDSATLGKVSRDYWSPSKRPRDKARSFIARLQDLGVFVTFGFTHVAELLRHGNPQVVRDRLGFLRSVPLIAWLRPYDRHWFPGAVTDLLLRELHVVAHGSRRDWRGVVDEVRPQLWETGVGSEMFVEDDELWTALQAEFKHQQENEAYVASMARTDPGNMKDVKLGDALRSPIRPQSERNAYLREFAQQVQEQLERHGDKRLASAQEAAITLGKNALHDIEANEREGGNPVQGVPASLGIPEEFVSPEMTLGELGELGVYARRLRLLAERLQPPVELTMKEVPPGALPSYVLERKVFSIQMKGERVSGSDLGDAHVAPLILYADDVEVDRRIHEYLRQVERNEPKLASLMGRFFRSPDYSKIPQLLDEAG